MTIKHHAKRLNNLLSVIVSIAMMAIISYNLEMTGFFKKFSIIWIIVWALVILGAISPLYINSDLWLIGMKWFYSRICHQLSSRCIVMGNSPMLVCSRCFGIYSGLFITWIFLVIFRRISLYIFRKVMIPVIFIIPALTDWLLKALGIIPINNITGIITGFLMGTGFTILVFNLVYQEENNL